MKGFILVLFLTVTYHTSFGQVGNEWINYSQPYFKIPVAKDGIYRLTAGVLAAAGVPSGTDPSRLQIFHRGVEQAITVSGENDGALNSGDYVEFYGRHNDGTLDAELYKPQSAQPHPYYNLFSDTTAYFLTIGSAAGKRMTTFDESGSGLTPEPFHYDEKIILNITQYAAGLDISEVQSTTFDIGEGWTGDQILQGQAADYSVSGISQIYPTGGLPEIELGIVGRGPMQHLVEVYVGASQRLVSATTFSGFESNKFVQAIAWSDIGGDGTLPVRVKCVGTGGEPTVSARPTSS